MKKSILITAILTMTLIVSGATSTLPILDDLSANTNVTVYAADAVSSPIVYYERDSAGNMISHRESASKITSGTTELLNDYYTVDSDVTVNDRITVQNGATAKIILQDGVSITCKKGIAVNEGSALIIYGQAKDSGKLLAESDSRNAGIGSDCNTNCGDITVHGGDIHATGTNTYTIGGSAAIGGGDAKGNGNITIYGGSITAKGGNYGAGIGGGDEGCVDKPIKIYGGYVTATGGDFGAGIGGGDEAECKGNIDIYGGVVIAKGGDKGACIGSGNNGDYNGVITIHGGNVTCDNILTGGAGIGSGYRANVNKIVFEGGTVKTYGYAGSAAIGGGDWGTVNEVVINGGEIHAESVQGAGIGSGDFEDFKGKVTVTGGIVDIKSCTGAGIGSAQRANFAKKALVDIQGGDISIAVNDGGSGIGSGGEATANLPYGGECEGTVKITGGKVNIDVSKRKNYDRKATSIGHGWDGDENGTLILGDDMKVTVGSEIKKNAERADACRTYDDPVTIEKCDHAETLSYLVLDDDKHKSSCQYCNYSKEEAHDETVPCICGYNGTVSGLFKVTYTYGEHKKTVYKNNIVFPTFHEIFPEYEKTDEGMYVVWFWKIGDVGYAPGIEYSPMRNIEAIANVKLKYWVDVDSNIEHGSVWTESDCLAEGEKLKIHCEADLGYKPDTVKILYPNGKERTFTITNPPLIIDMPANPVHIYATFAKEAKQPIIIDDKIDGGSVVCDKDSAELNEKVALSIEAKEEYQLKDVCYYVISTGEKYQITKENDTYTFTMPDEAVMIHARFEPVYIKGDVNFDQKIDDEDAELVLKHISGTKTLDEQQLLAAKVTDDEKETPDILDVIWILNNTSKNDN